jgi:hypothetical protein
MKRFIFYALDQYTLKVYRRKEWEAGVKHGVICEQQRIIKLLEAEKFILPEGIAEGLTLMPIQDAIALIKGEK